MKNLTKLALVSAITLGFAGIVNAGHEVVNGDAETMDLTGWNADAEITVTTGPDGNGQVDSGDAGGDGYYFDFAGSAVGEDGSASMDQSIDVYPCGAFEYLAGSMSVDYIYSTGGGDLASAAIGFDGGGATDSDSGLISRGSWTSSTLSSAVPMGATELDIVLTGAENPASSTGNFANVGFDNVVVSTSDCPDAFYKISGKIGTGRGTHSFWGAVGIDHDSGDVFGSIMINYKDLDEICTYTPSTLVFSGDDFAYSTGITSGDLSCVDGDGATTFTGIADQVVTNADTSTNNKNNNKDRGRADLVASDSTYSIGVACDPNLPPSNAPCGVALRNGNVIINSDTSDG